MNPMLELLAARRNPFETNPARSVMRSAAQARFTMRMAVCESSPRASIFRGGSRHRTAHPHADGLATMREPTP